jgi:hypothetical protein
LKVYWISLKKKYMESDDAFINNHKKMYTWVSIKSISISIYVENKKWCSVSILGYFFLFFLLFKTICLPMFLLFRGYLIWIIFLGARLIQTLDDRSSIIKWLGNCSCIWSEQSRYYYTVIERSYDFFQRRRSMSFYKNDCNG